MVFWSLAIASWKRSPSMTTATFPNHDTATQAPPRRWVTLAWASEYTTFSPNHLRRFVQDGRLRAYRPGGRRLVFDIADLDALITGGSRRREKRPRTANASGSCRDPRAYLDANDNNFEVLVTISPASDASNVNTRDGPSENGAPASTNGKPDNPQAKDAALDKVSRFGQKKQSLAHVLKRRTSGMGPGVSC
jgi:excisionase family DNA binding protein